MCIDSELAAVLPFIPPQDFSDLDECRRLSDQVNEPYDQSTHPEVEFSNQYLTRPDGTQFLVRVAFNPDSVQSAAVVLHFHGGGFCIGHPTFDDAENAQIVAETGAIVVSPDYRLAPEFPYPAGFNDCVQTYEWITSPQFRWKPASLRLGLLGHSAGAGIAAAVALWARDHCLQQPTAQFLLEPELDARLETPSAINCIDTPIWYRSNAELSWEYYLGGRPADQYASVALAHDLTGLPKTYLTVNQIDPLRDEGMIYASRLMAANVPTEIHCWPAAYHGFMAIRSAKLSHRAMNQLVSVLSSYLAPRLP